MKFYFLPVLMLSTLAAQASEYPADYSINSTCQTQGSIQVCRATQVFYNLPVFDIRYTGNLLNSSGLSVWLKINDQNAKQTTLPMNLINGGALASARITGGCLTGKLGGCAQAGTPEMRDLLIWAQQSNGTLNAIDLDIAFFDGQGNWDNNGRSFGTYHFAFPQQLGY